MKTTIPKPGWSGSALMLTLIMSAIALAILAGVMSWAASSNRLTHRSIQYTRSVAAAEAATEKAVSQITQDFLSGGPLIVSQNLNTYRQSTVPSSMDSSYWNTWVFDDGNGNLNQTYVQFTGTNTIVLDAPYTGLKGYASIYTVASHARDTASMQNVNAGVLQQLQLTGIPIFQFAMYSAGNMEISCGHPFDVTGHVHANGKLYIEPDQALTFESGVTAVDGIYEMQRDPLDNTRGDPKGSFVYAQTNEVDGHVQAMTLPIGTTNTPEAVREIIEPPPASGDTNAATAGLRYYNLCDMVIFASDTGVSAKSGKLVNNFSTPIPTNDVLLFVNIITNNFKDARENKIVHPIDINIGSLKTWSETNSILHPFGSNLSSIYIVDNRTTLTLPAADLGAVRVFNGRQLPVNGLTVATGRPLYVWGDYNQTNDANLGTTNTITTRPASLVADAITILSTNWVDAASVFNAASGTAGNTTVNAALLTGVVETTLGQYSGGMENFPRFLETWGPIVFTYNGSMVKMFPSLYATNFWEGLNMNVKYYEPPTRNWAYDGNFDYPTKLPPQTPSLLKVIRGQWATVPPGTNTLATIP